MRLLAGFIVAASIGGALGGAAVAAEPTRISDADFVQAARCVGLASSPALGSSDGAALKALVKSQGWGREPFILDKADETQREARLQADRAGPETKARLNAELTGACAALKG